MSGQLWSGVLLVARQEFRVRLRTGRWRWVLAAWVAVMAGFTALLTLALASADMLNGVPLFGGLMLFVLALVLLISPALTGQSINGDRERGTLAALQVTRLRPAQIVVGKLAAGWMVGLTALGLTLPFVGWALVLGGASVARTVVTLLVVALLIGVVCAVSQAMSALFARSITSALVSYLVVFALTVGTLVAFALALPITADSQTMTESNGEPYSMTVTRSDRVWWLLAPNPFVVLADAAPPAAPHGRTGGEPLDVLGTIGKGTRRLRGEPNFDGSPPRGGPVWPYGLAFDLALGAGALWVTVRQLRAPAERMPKGVRIA
jgi:ABC-type transport system involved in multi-copper enzyme maturation permease subunit